MAEATFTSTRTTEPDRTSLLTALRATVDPTIGIRMRTPGDPYVLKKDGAAWTPAQITAAQGVIDTAPETTPQMRYARISRDKDLLATIALIVRAKNFAAWTALTTPQKVALVLAEADVWITIRDFLENNA